MPTATWGVGVTQALSAAVDLHDVDDPIGFVRRAVHLSDLRLSTDEREELLADGLLILCQMEGV